MIYAIDIIQSNLTKGKCARRYALPSLSQIGEGLV